MNPAAIAALLSGDIDNFLVASQPGGIERQEAQGQATFVSSDMLPKEISGGQATIEKLKQIGFEFGKEIDDLFVECKLPKGWKRAGSDHSMHSSIQDEQGRERISVFYKAAFYDRRADCRVMRRYNVSAYIDSKTDGIYIIGILDGNRLVKPFHSYNQKERDYKIVDAHTETAKQWLKENYPDYENPFAYWE